MNGLVLYQLFSGISLFLNIVRWLLLAYCIMSWIVRPTNAVYIQVSRFAQVLLAPFRPISRWLMQKGVMIDLSAILAFITISILQNLVWRIYYWIP